ncbi:MAG: MFS transporter [Elusimicrobia bacterium]|nr:MFS transporter [Elusimicrobiota bacterium]
MISLFKKEILAWAFYDFANSAFATTILAVVFNVYFVKVICSGGVLVGKFLIPSEAFWAYSFSFSTLIIFFLSPILGAQADLASSKKKFLILFSLLGAISTGFLSCFKEGDYWAAALFFVLANSGFALANVFYNAFLKSLSTPNTVGRVSAIGWAFGYIGGGLLLFINLWMIQRPEWFFIPLENHLPTRAAIFSVSIWWILFSLPIFFWLDEPKSPQLEKQSSVFIGFQNVLQTLKNLKNHKEIFKFFLAYLIYNDGIETIIIMASIFGAQELKMSQSELILCFLLIQGVAFLGSLLFGSIADTWGHKISIWITLIIFCAVTLWAALILKSKFEFWILGAVVGLILGGSQSASRSFLSLLSPKEKSAQFFGFFALTGKVSNVVGPLTFGLLVQFFSLRIAVFSLTFFFIVGIFLLFYVNPNSLNNDKITNP